MVDQPKPDDNQKNANDASHHACNERLINRTQAAKVEDPAQHEDAEHPHGKLYFLKLRAWWNDPFRAHARWTDKAVVFLTMGIVYMAWMQWKEMDDSGKQTDEIICADNRIAKAMEDSLGQAQLAYSATTRQAEVTQRAWLGAMVIAADKMEIGKVFHIRVIFQNTGRTPALKVKSAVTRSIVVVQEHPDLGLPSPSYERKNYTTAGNINPDSTYVTDKEIPIGISEFSAFNGDTARIYVHGRFEYDDVFGMHHWGTFCQVYLTGGMFAYCDKYNEMDNNQPKASKPKPN